MLRDRIRVEEKIKRVTRLKVSASAGECNWAREERKPCFSELEVSLQMSSKRYGVLPERMRRLWVCMAGGCGDRSGKRTGLTVKNCKQMHQSWASGVYRTV